MSMLGDMMEIESSPSDDVGSVKLLGWHRHKRRNSTNSCNTCLLIWQAWQCRQLGWHRGMIARVIVPDRKATHLLVKRIPQGQIQLMAVVKLVVIPILIEVIILSLVPRERIRNHSKSDDWCDKWHQPQRHRRAPLPSITCESQCSAGGSMPTQLLY